MYTSQHCRAINNTIYIGELTFCILWLVCGCFSSAELGKCGAQAELTEQADLVLRAPLSFQKLDVSTQEGLIFCLSSYFSPKSDRNKLYAHELESCANKIPLHYETCNAVPVFAGEWSIAVDDCMPFLNARFEDVGQCDHIDLRKDDPYWQNHLRCTKI